MTAWLYCVIAWIVRDLRDRQALLGAEQGIDDRALEFVLGFVGVHAIGGVRAAIEGVLGRGVGTVEVLEGLGNFVRNVLFLGRQGGPRLGQLQFVVADLHVGVPQAERDRRLEADVPACLLRFGQRGEGA